MGFQPFLAQHKLPSDHLTQLIAWRFWFHHPEYWIALAVWAACVVTAARRRTSIRCCWRR